MDYTNLEGKLLASRKANGELCFSTFYKELKQSFGDQTALVRVVDRDPESGRITAASLGLTVFVHEKPVLFESAAALSDPLLDHGSVIQQCHEELSKQVLETVRQRARQQMTLF